MSDDTPRERDDFNPRQYMRRVQGGADYLEVKWRLLWMRKDHPEANIVTDLLRIEDGFALFRASVTYHEARTDDLVTVTGHGAETKSDFGDFIEKAETKAIGRALQHAGYGTAGALDDGEGLADAPVQQRPAPQQRQQRPQPRPPAPARTAGQTPAQTELGPALTDDDPVRRQIEDLQTALGWDVGKLNYHAGRVTGLTNYTLLDAAKAKSLLTFLSQEAHKRGVG